MRYVGKVVTFPFGRVILVLKTSSTTSFALKKLAQLVDIHSRTDIPSSVLFPWLHGIGDGPNGLAGGPLEEFFGFVPSNFSFLFFFFSSDCQKSDVTEA